MTEIVADYLDGVKVRVEKDKRELFHIMDLGRAVLDLLEFFRQDSKGYSKKLYDKSDFAYQVLLAQIDKEYMKDLKQKEDK